jgi:nuclear pore complex protein Nup133
MGVEDSIHGMLSGEHVAQIINAEPVGFVLVFSSGRLAHMSVRDGHGRPAISVQFLRNSPGPSSGGFFGSLRNALSTTTVRGGVAAVRAGPGNQVGERIVVAATSKGKLHLWRVLRGGQHEFITDLETRDCFLNAITKADPGVSGIPDEGFEIVDFAFVPRGLEEKYKAANRLSEAPSREDDSSQHLLFLASFNGKANSRHSLVELVITGRNFDVGLVRPLKSYKSPFRSSAPERPRLYLPRPGLVAFVVLDQAVVIASLTEPPASADVQLHGDGQMSSSAYEDIIDFQELNSTQIVGSGIEEPLGGINGLEDMRGHRHKTKNPATVLLVQGVGVVRIAITDIDRFASQQPPMVTAKSKLEQAVFFGIRDDNPLVFRGRRALPFKDEEIGNAAIALSNEILMSKTPFISNVPTALGSSMKTRLGYLDRLISHLNALNVNLDQRARWMLLYNAEKMSVATWIWQRYEDFMATRPKDNYMSLIASTVICINEEQKTEPRLDIGEVDPVRHWFINDIWRLEIFVAWGYQIIKNVWKDRRTNESGINRLVWEAVTMQNGALQKAHEYRERHYELYGLSSAVNHGRDAVPEPWTACHYLINNLKRLLEFCYQWLETHYGDPNTSVDVSLLDEVRNALPSLTAQWFTILNEYVKWAEKTDDARAKQFSETCAVTYSRESMDKIQKLKDFEMWDEAIDLAEQFKLWKALATVIVDHMDHLGKLASGAMVSTTGAGKVLLSVDERARQLGGLIDRYGKNFAMEAFGCLLETHGIQEVLDFPYGDKDYKTAFLREKPELAKISWINDVEQEKDIQAAAETLVDLGVSREQQIWNKKIELSLGKLALLAEETDEPVAPGASVSSLQSEREAQNSASIEKVDRELSIIKIQDSLYAQIFPSITDAVDDAAELELAVMKHCLPSLQKQKALFQIFEDALGRLLRHEALSPVTLIDLLTLIYLDMTHFEQIGDQFCLALRVAELGLKGQARIDAQRLTWRRCFLRDDWKKVNETNLKPDVAQLEVIGETAAWRAYLGVIYESKWCTPLRATLTGPY